MIFTLALTQLLITLMFTRLVAYKLEEGKNVQVFYLSKVETIGDAYMVASGKIYISV